ncbi:MAG: biotin carboxylase, partial [Saprospiraceae bacterium]|nr:biotin carboxylase [Saprospiraceae bacterium]
DLASQMARAISEAKSSFGDDAVFVEKYVSSPRHIEVQVLADKFGNTVHLFERECSVQRRHQKVVEEAPSVILDDDLRRRMGEAAVNVAKACKYEGAGTVEFLMDADLNFYFLEMNTRLQVEHPVTELITGLDLVQLQLKIAAGEPLPFSQEDLSITGHAIELRVYAEDPEQNFLPSVGKLERYRPPSGKGVRLDDGYREGMEIPIFYDPLIGKLVAYGKDRPEAIDRLIRAIHDFEIEGIKTTLPFGTFVLNHPSFRSGNFDTHFVKEFFPEGALKGQQAVGAETATALAKILFDKEANLLKTRKDDNRSWRSRVNSQD